MFTALTQFSLCQVTCWSLSHHCIKLTCINLLRQCQFTHVAPYSSGRYSSSHSYLWLYCSILGPINMNERHDCTLFDMFWVFLSTGWQYITSKQVEGSQWSTLPQFDHNLSPVRQLSAGWRHNRIIGKRNWNESCEIHNRNGMRKSWSGGPGMCHRVDRGSSTFLCLRGTGVS